jgi:hypothetical protein
MAGWIIDLSDEKYLELYVQNGVYGTRFKKPDEGVWNNPQEKTIADYALIEEEDLVFFFLKRKIYGIGKIVGFDTKRGRQAVFFNYPDSILPENFPAGARDCLWPEQFDSGYWSSEDRARSDIRFVIFFKPCPSFFKSGLDMDFVLQSDSKGVINQIRAFERRSFIKMDDEETGLLVELFTRVSNTPPEIYSYSEDTFESVSMRLKDSRVFDFDPRKLIMRSITDNGFAREAIMQIAFAYGLRYRDRDITNAFGTWDYICNQVSASPFKPISAMEFIDIFGYSYKTLNSNLPRAIKKFFIIELKRGNLTEGRSLGRFEKDSGYVAQALKYVDWVANYRAGGDYNLIKAFLVARGFSRRIIDFAREARTRNYVLPRRPFRSDRWDGLSLVEYTVDEGRLVFKEALG